MLLNIFLYCGSFKNIVRVFFPSKVFFLSIIVIFVYFMDSTKIGKKVNGVDFFFFFSLISTEMSLFVVNQ